MCIRDSFRPDLMGKRPTKKVSHCVMYDQSLKGDAMPLRNVPRANKDERVMNTRIDKDQVAPQHGGVLTVCSSRRFCLGASRLNKTGSLSTCGSTPSSQWSGFGRWSTGFVCI
eukprot:TRINITY_DN9980_c0_g1_i2.p1 TRINITY_DN9980_c0_g1~~TRINITY_DN9980_c0_g1_i2.p1  ORF type:complete len:113 (-),score=10.32 TRINITY_DN9980_c0_g1_i2:203-541(-)